MRLQDNYERLEKKVGEEPEERKGLLETAKDYTRVVFLTSYLIGSSTVLGFINRYQDEKVVHINSDVVRDVITRRDVIAHEKGHFLQPNEMLNRKMTYTEEDSYDSVFNKMRRTV